MIEANINTELVIQLIGKYARTKYRMQYNTYSMNKDT